MFSSICRRPCLAKSLRWTLKLLSCDRKHASTLRADARQSSVANGYLLPHRCSCFWPANIFPPPTEWGYLLEDGPPTWPEKYPPARGQHQSPIDIQTSQVLSSSELKGRPLTWSYDSQVCKSVVNAGNGWRVDILPGEEAGGLSGGPLAQCYELIQFHCHWGETSDQGSEHVVDGKPYVGELHFVHWNKEAHASCTEAVSVRKGLTVIAVFLQVGEPNPEIAKLCSALQDIPFRDQRADLPADFDPTYLYPADHSYWTYEGSLTTPPCYESVTWIVFKQPITVSEDQLQSFRALHTHTASEEQGEGCCCSLVPHNFRPPQALNDRLVRECSYS